MHGDVCNSFKYSTANLLLNDKIICKKVNSQPFYNLFSVIYYISLEYEYKIFAQIHFLQNAGDYLLFEILKILKDIFPDCLLSSGLIEIFY